ncbi:MAG: hypothetical protein JKY17_06500 [Magnetovibrio sp.]|nr:hypothetical protein [Magnetovibrio sp.]
MSSEFIEKYGNGELWNVEVETDLENIDGDFTVNMNLVVIWPDGRRLVKSDNAFEAIMNELRQAGALTSQTDTSKENDENVT